VGWHCGLAHHTQGELQDMGIKGGEG
jgi:hypothetical protein